MRFPLPSLFFGRTREGLVQGIYSIYIPALGLVLFYLTVLLVETLPPVLSLKAISCALYIGFVSFVFTMLGYYFLPFLLRQLSAFLSFLHIHYAEDNNALIFLHSNMLTGYMIEDTSDTN